MGRMCAASWPHMLDFPALVHIVASRLDKGHIGEQADLSGAPQGIPDLLSKWLNKQAKVDVSPSEGPHQMSPDFGEPLNTSLLQGMY